MSIVFRVDSSNIIGTGHVFRCLNFAYHYKKIYKIFFICKNYSYNLISKIEEEYQVFKIGIENETNIKLDHTTWLGESEEADADKTIEIIKKNKLQVDWLIIDHYSIGEIWENRLKPFVKKILVIDDYTNRKHICNILINQQISKEDGLLKYKNILNKDCKIYCGNEYLLLHPRYIEYQNIVKNYDKKNIERVNIFMGGADTPNITNKILDVCANFNKNIIFDVIVGKSNKNKLELERRIKNLKNFNFYYDLQYIGDLILKADICIGAIGSTSYERCLLKTPSLCICIAENQKTVLDKFIKSNTIKYLGTINDNYLDKLEYFLNYFNNNINELKIMSNNCSNFIDIKENKIKYIIIKYND